MKRPLAEYLFMGFGCVFLATGLVSASCAPGSYLLSVFVILLAFLPFCLPWHKNRHPYLFLLSLLVPLLVSWIGLPQLLQIHRQLARGAAVFDPLPLSIYLGFLNMHLIVFGTAALTAYAAFQTWTQLQTKNG